MVIVLNFAFGDSIVETLVKSSVTMLNVHNKL